MQDDSKLPPTVCLYGGKHVQLLARGHWEYAVRTVASGAVGILAITSDDQVVLVEQFRIPVAQRVIELPAGLVGDTAELSGEPMLVAAQRELLEETGYVSEHWTYLGEGYTTPGLSDESVAFFLAEQAHRQAEGGGDDSEDITVHHVPLAQLDTWLAEKQSQGMAYDVKLLSCLHLAEGKRQNKNS